VELCCTAPSETSERRIEERRLRGDDISDATIQVARAMSAAADPWPSSTEIDTSLAPDDSLVAALSVLDKEPPLASRVLRTP
jgi:predicted kinase